MSQTPRETVWIVEDSPLEGQVARHALAPRFDVELFIDGESMIEALQTQKAVPPPDVLVLDWRLTGMSGVDVCRFLRGDDRTMRLPILILTGVHRKTDNIVEALAAGANDFLAKPFVDAELRARVGALVRASALHERVERAERQLRRLLAELPDPLIAVDDRGQVALWNDEATRLFGITGHEQLGALEAVLPQLAGGVQAGRRELPHVDIGGRIYSPAVRAIELARGVSTRIIALRDVTDAVTAVRARDQFLAMLAHELRNPLAPIVTALDVLRRTRGDAASQRRVEETIDRQVGRLRRLVDDLLDVSRITRGSFRLDRRPVDLGGAVTVALESVAPLITERQHRVDVSLPSTPVFVDADLLRLEQVVVNLLTNAARYTPVRGRITASVQARGGSAFVRVADNGIGIEPAMMTRIFELFVQADTSLDRTGAGLGIGLTLARQLTEAHGGRLTAASEGIGRGSEFTLELPVASAPERPAAAPPPPPAAAAPRRPLRVLLVDDNVDAAETLADLLAGDGDDVRIAFDGAAALDTAASFRPDAVILDLGLPILDGYEVARRLRSMPGGGEVFIVALTGYGGADDRRRSGESGFDEHLVKPIKLDVFRTLLSRRFPN